MLTYRNPNEYAILQRFLANWRNPANRLPSLVSVDMAWTILLNHINISRKPVDQTTYQYYSKLYAKPILAMYRSRLPSLFTN